MSYPTIAGTWWGVYVRRELWNKPLHLGHKPAYHSPTHPLKIPQKCRVSVELAKNFPRRFNTMKENVCHSLDWDYLDKVPNTPGKQIPVMVKTDPPKLFPPRTNFSINKDPLELILLQNMDSVWKIWTTSHRLKKTRKPWTYFICKIWTSGVSRRFPRLLETAQARQFSSTQCTVVSFPATSNTRSLLAHIVPSLRRTHTSNNAVWGCWGIFMKSSILWIK